MKKLVLLFTGMLIGLTTVTAEAKSASQGEDLVLNRNYYAQPILFTERGMEFLIFPDGITRKETIITDALTPIQNEDQ